MTAEPTASAIPPPPKSESRRGFEESKPSSTQRTEIRKDEVEPKFRLHLNDLSHPASSQFLNLVDGSRVLPNALSIIRKSLYPHMTDSASRKKQIDFHLPQTRSVTVILRPMDGVAYTTGIDLDSSHKEIHFNLNYIRDCTDRAERRRHEIIGVITHEMVHCYQYDGFGTAPGGLIEGIADFVRLKADLGPPHWFGENGKRQRGDKWDAGYQKTAFFLDWLEETNGVGTVGTINETLRTTTYSEDSFWQSIFGKEKSIKVLWDDYCAAQDPKEETTLAMEQETPEPGMEREDDKRESNTPIMRLSHESDDIVVVDKE